MEGRINVSISYLEIISKAMIVTTPQHGPFGLMIYKILYKSPKVMINV
jgi:hypothetical protein